MGMVYNLWLMGGNTASPSVPYHLNNANSWSINANSCLLSVVVTMLSSIGLTLTIAIF